MQLTPRLEAIARKVTYKATVADIGTDHAYIPIYLVENNVTNIVYACDINQGPINMANKQIEKYGYTKEITTMLGPGLDPIVGMDVENIIIAGMGGILIKGIIEANKETALNAHRLILQPMIAQEELRQYLIQNGFQIIEEDLAQEDRRIYQIILAKKGKSEPWAEIDYHISPILVQDKHPLLHELITAKENELNKIIKACSVEKSENAKVRREECRSLLEKIKVVKKCL